MLKAPSHASATPRVLIVEDEAQVCELLSEMVRDEGFETHCVGTDREAYAALHGERRQGYACMIVDVNLGSGTTGYDVARFARKLQSGLPVIYVSGQTSEASYRANGVPGSLFVPKPFTADELTERLRKLVGDNDHL
jgi:DNA-binding response OmpR family regulator